MLSIFLAAVTVAAPPACKPVPGVDALFAKPTAHIVWVGEVHGTSEDPAMFADLVCAAAKTGRPVMVALERPQAEQPFWGAFLQSKGAEADKAAFLRAPIWTWPMQDGRNSRAMLALAEQLREDRGAGLIVGVRLIDPPVSASRFDAGARDAGMADAVAAAAKADARALVLVYSGNLHNQRGKNTAAAQTYTYAAGLLPADEVVTVNLIGDDGEAWNCQADGCRAHPYLGDGGVRRVEKSSSDSAYDFIGYTGAPTTASPPAHEGAGPGDRR